MKFSKTALFFLMMIGSRICTAVPETFFQSNIQLANQDSIQRLHIPASIIIASQRDNLSDIQVLDANYHPMPIAWLNDAISSTVITQTPIAVFPIIGSDTSANNNTSLSISTQHGERVVTLTDAMPHAPQKHTIGALLDTRNMAETQQAIQLTLDAETAAGEIINISIASSSDLSHWQTLVENASIAQFKVDHNTSNIHQNRVTLPPTNLHNQYVRIMWDSRSNMVLHGAQLSSQTHTSQQRQAEAITLTPSLQFATNKQTLSWQLPHLTYIDAINVQTQHSGLVPVQLYGRENSQNPWQPLTNGAIYNIIQQGKTSKNSNFALMQNIKELRIDAMQGFELPADITVQLLMSPKDIAFIKNGVAPYQLAIVKRGALTSDNVMSQSINTLIPNYHLGDENNLPIATLESLASDKTLPSINNIVSANKEHTYILWGILAGSICLLSAMVLIIWRQMQLVHKE